MHPMNDSCRVCGSVGKDGVTCYQAPGGSGSDGKRLDMDVW